MKLSRNMKATLILMAVSVGVVGLYELMTIIDEAFGRKTLLGCFVVYYIVLTWFLVRRCLRPLP